MYSSGNTLLFQGKMALQKAGRVGVKAKLSKNAGKTPQAIAIRMIGCQR